jgi:hypothetical protein
VEPSKYAMAEEDKNAAAEKRETAGGTETPANAASEPEAEMLGGRGIETVDPMVDELLTVRLRYKQPDSDESTRFDVSVVDEGLSIESAGADVQFAAAVASLGMLLRNSPYKGSASWAQILDLAEAGRGADQRGYRAEFIELVERAQAIAEARKTESLSR